MKVFKVILIIFFLGFIVFSFLNKEDNSIKKNTKNLVPLEVIFKPKVKSKDFKLLFFGDLMLDRGVSYKIDREGFEKIFENIENVLREKDAVIANLEGVFSSNESLARRDRSILRFTFNPNLALKLKNYNFKYLSQANNHTNDFGKEGAEESRKILAGSGIDYFGDYFNNQGKVSRINSPFSNISLLSYNEFSYNNLSGFLELIKQEKEMLNFVIVMPHWGIEYEKKNSPFQSELAHKFIDSGADVVIGSHPHVVQNIELYKNKLIFYSLGNFVFDQDFSKETTEGLGVEIIFSKEKKDFNLIPINIIKSVVTLKNEEEKKLFLEELSGISDSFLRFKIIEGKISF